MKSESEASREAGFAPPSARHYLRGMTDKPKRPRDANQLAKFIVDVATGDPDAEKIVRDGQGSEGGKARARKLSPEERSDIAKKAAKSRWGADP